MATFPSSKGFFLTMYEMIPKSRQHNMLQMDVNVLGTRHVLFPDPAEAKRLLEVFENDDETMIGLGGLDIDDRPTRGPIEISESDLDTLVDTFQTLWEQANQDRAMHGHRSAYALRGVLAHLGYAVIESGSHRQDAEGPRFPAPYDPTKGEVTAQKCKSCGHRWHEGRCLNGMSDGGCDCPPLCQGSCGRLDHVDGECRG